MKRCCFVLAVIIVLLAVSVSAMASATNWYIRINATNTNGLYPAGDCTIGWYKNYTNDIDTNEMTSLPGFPYGGKNVVVSAVVPGGTAGSLRDFREPLSNANGDYSKMALPRTWTFNVYMQGNWNLSDKIRINFKPVAGEDGEFPLYALPSNMSVQIRGAINDSFSISQWAARTTPWYYDIAGDGNPYTFYNPLTFTLTITPEPSSLAALLCGLGSLGAIVLRRRQ